MKRLWVVGLVLVGVAAAQKAEWKRYELREAGCSVILPFSPTKSVQNVEFGTIKGKATSWASMGGALRVAATHVALQSVEGIRVNDIFAGIESGFLASVEGKATGRRPATYSGVSGRLLGFQTSSKAQGTMWMAYKGKAIYIFTIATEDDSSLKLRDKFFSSLQFSKR